MVSAAIINGRLPGSENLHGGLSAVPNYDILGLLLEKTMPGYTILSLPDHYVATASYHACMEKLCTNYREKIYPRIWSDIAGFWESEKMKELREQIESVKFAVRMLQDTSGLKVVGVSSAGE